MPLYCHKPLSSSPFSSGPVASGSHHAMVKSSTATKSTGSIFAAGPKLIDGVVSPRR